MHWYNRALYPVLFHFVSSPDTLYVSKWQLQTGHLMGEPGRSSWSLAETEAAFLNVLIVQSVPFREGDVPFREITEASFAWQKILCCRKYYVAGVTVPISGEKKTRDFVPSFKKY